MPVSPSSVRIDLARDQNLDDFSRVTLAERYLVPGETSPQQAFARAAAAFADDETHAQAIYDYASKGWFSFATPLLSNGGTDRGLPISCFLTAVEDSREGIFDHFTEVGWLSSVGGGVGAYFGDLRSNGEKTSRGSQSTGVVPFMCVDDRLILSVSQGGTRRGSLAVYLDIHHPEIEEFVTLRKPTGGDQNRKALNLHNGINVTDDFMIALKKGEPYPLRSPKTGETIRFVNPRELWRLIIETRMQTGEPYLHFIDHSNRGLPETQKRKGLKVRQSNLCVGPLTEVLTRDGHKPIAGLEDTDVEVWNGRQWSTVTVRKTAVGAELVRVWFADGGYLDCTPEHKFYLDDGSEVRAGALQDGAVLEAPDSPVIAHDSGLRLTDGWAYTAGWSTVAGFEDENRLTVYAPVDLDDEGRRRLLGPSQDAISDEEGLTIRYEPRKIDAGFVPLTWSVQSRVSWLSGVLDAVGDVVDVDGDRAVGFVTPDAELVKQMRLMALELGMSPRVRLSDAGSLFSISSSDVAGLVGTGLLRRFDMPRVGVLPDDRPVVTDVHPLPGRFDTYCFTEALRHRGVFNGYLTGQCTEITLPTGRDDQGKQRTAVCCLSSVNAEKYDEWKNDVDFIPNLMRMLDNTLEVFIQNAPDGLANARYSASMERSVGLGCLGFHYLLQQRNLAFESQGARDLNLELFRHIQERSDAASLVLGAERGEAPDMKGTGHRFAHRRAIAPNASSSILLNTSPSIEPVRANAYLHKTLSGSFTVRNPYLVKALTKLGINTAEVWKSINANEGSVQHFDVERFDEEGEPLGTPFAELDIEMTPKFLADWTQVKAVFKTATELDMWWVLRLAADRQRFIDQAQSVNVFYSSGTAAPLLLRDHWLAWQWGLKSLYYLRSTTAKRAENVNTSVKRKSTGVVHIGSASFSAHSKMTVDGVVMPASPMADSDCIACEG